MARLFYLTKEFVKQGHNATLITSDANHFCQFPSTDKTYNFEQVDNVPVYWLKTKKYQKTASISRILSWLDFEWKLFRFSRKKLEKPDVVIVSSLSIFTVFYGHYLKRKYKAKLVFEVRDIWPLTMTEEGGFSKWHPLVLLIGWIEKFAYKKADLIVGTMPKLDQHVRNMLGYERPFFCSPLGFDRESRAGNAFTVNDDAFANVLPKGKLIVGYTGSMGITNALEPFVQTIKLLKDDQGIHFALLGGGALENQFEAELAECSNVIFLGRVPQEQVACFLDHCDLVYLSVHHSKVWDYGQSMNKVVEYMLTAKPIIASYAGYPSMINEAVCGEFIDSSEPEVIKKELLKFAALTAEQRKAVGEKGRQWILQHRSYEALANQYLNRLDRLLKGVS